MFDDDGASKNSIASKKYELIKVKASPVSNGYKFEFSSNGGVFAGKPASRIFHLILHGVPENLDVSGGDTQKVKKSPNLNGDQEFRFVFTGKPFSVNLKMK